MPKAKTVQKLIEEMIIDRKSSKEIADFLGISVSMVSAYKKSYNPSLEVARRVYKADGTVLYPFSLEGVQGEAK